MSRPARVKRRFFFFAARVSSFTVFSVLSAFLCHQKQGNQRKVLKPGDKPQASFAICEGDEVVAAYAYCNLHSLWKKEVEEKKQEEKMPDGDYIVCKCNHVSYYDIIDEVHKHSNMEELLKVFEDVRDTTRCSTGCGGCYDKVMDIISRTIMG